MKRTSAEAASKLLLNATSLLNEAVWVVKDAESNEDFEKVRKKLGNIMMDIYTEVLGPIYSEHPDIAPDELRKNFTRP